MEIVQSFAAEVQRQTAEDDVADGTTLLEGAKLDLRFTEQEQEALHDLSDKHQEVENHFALTQRQVNGVRPHGLEQVENHGSESDERQAEHEHDVVKDADNQADPTHPVSLISGRLLQLRREETEEELLQANAHFPNQL